MDRTADRALVGEAARYLEDTAPNHGGRNTRPLAIPVLVTTYCSGARTGAAAGAAALGVLAGVAVWFGVAQLSAPDGSSVLAVVGIVLAVALAGAGAVLAARLVRSGTRLAEALRRWHQVAPEVPVRGAEVLVQRPGLLRITLSGLSVLAGIGALVLAAAVEGGPPVWVGAGVAAAALLASGTAGAIGWWRVRSLLAPTAPQGSQETFAPAPYAQPHPAAPAHGQPQHEPAGPPQPAPSPLQWAPPPEPVPQPPAAQPWQPAGAVAGGETWRPEPEIEPDIGDTQLVADTTRSGRSSRPVVLLDDGRRLTAGVTALLGRAPVARLDEPDAEAVPVLHPTVSKTHAAIRVTDSSVYVTDRASTNGTTAVDPSGAARRLAPWTETEVHIGGEVLLGSYRVSVAAAEEMP